MFLRVLGIIMILGSAWGCESLSTNYHTSEETQPDQPELTMTSFSKAPSPESSPLSESMVIPEEVEELAPELVAHGSDGQPYSVRYHVLPSMLVNEMQKQQRTIAMLLARLDAVESQLFGESTGTD